MSQMAFCGARGFKSGEKSKGASDESRQSTEFSRTIPILHAHEYKRGPTDNRKMPRKRPERAAAHGMGGRDSASRDELREIQRLIKSYAEKEKSRDRDDRKR
jgi:hypothetical protein